MKLKIKRVYEPVEKSDGVRVLVDRLWPRGVSKEHVDAWLKEIAPSTALRRWYGHVPGKWISFRAKYRKELEANPDAVLKFRDIVKRGPATLLYGARDTERNQAVVLADFLRSHKPRAKPRKTN